MSSVGYGARRSFMATGTSFLALVAFAAPAFAQSEPAELEGTEIVVTAQKREQSLQDVPISVNVLSGDALEANRISSVEELQQLSPSLSFTNSANSRGQGLSVRGIGTLNFSDGVEPSVSTVIDGVVIGRQAQSVFDLIDIERVEVLRGPQGTLFGKNASAGVISIVTQRPSLTETEIAGSVSYAELDEIKVRASASAPIIADKLAARLTGYRIKRDGPIRNIFTGRDVNNQDQWGLRGKLLFAPSDDFDLLIIGDYAKIDRDCCIWTARTANPTTRYFGATGPLRTTILAGITPGPANREVSFDAPTFLRQKSWGVSAEANWQLGDHNVTSITAYRKFDLFDNNDADTVPLNILNLNNADQKQRQFTQEIRIASPAGQTLEYVLGMFYFDQKVETVTQVAGTFGAVLPAGAVLGSQIDRGITTKNAAAFGEFTFNATDALRFVAGARLTTEVLRVRFARTNLPGALGAAPNAGAPLNVRALKSDDTALSYRLAAQYDVNDEIMVYASHSRGYKGAAVNMLNNLSATLLNSGEAVIRPEIAKNYELGLRSTFFDRKLLLNLTGFTTTFDDFQTQSFNAALAAFVLDNAGKLRTRGVELEAIVKPATGLTFSANAAYTDAEIRSFLGNCYPGQTAAQGCSGTPARQNLAGKSINNAPKWAFSISGNYEAPLSGDLSLFLNSTYSYRSKVNFSINQDPNTIQKGYGIVNASVGIGAADGLWRLSAFAKNLFDTNFATTIFATPFDPTAGAPVGYSQILTESAQRMAGVAFDFRF
jgi:iron complex outermembrane recepter protein